MIKEFALDPDAITSSYREFCYFTEKFGVSQGRVISAFPKKWRKLVCDSALREHKGKVEFSKIVERLNKFGSDIVFDTGRPSGEGSLTWIDRALVACTQTLCCDYLSYCCRPPGCAAKR